MGWDESYRIGIEEIDNQHRHLFELKARLDVCCATKNCAKPKLFHKTLYELFKFAKEHFSTEENFMRSIGFPMQEAHCREHAKFLEDLSEITIHTWHGEPSHANTLELITQWIESHVFKSDMQIQDFMARNQNNTKIAGRQEITN